MRPLYNMYHARIRSQIEENPYKAGAALIYPNPGTYTIPEDAY